MVEAEPETKIETETKVEEKEIEAENEKKAEEKKETEEERKAREENEEKERQKCNDYEDERWEWEEEERRREYEEYQRRRKASEKKALEEEAAKWDNEEDRKIAIFKLKRRMKEFTAKEFMKNFEIPIQDDYKLKARTKIGKGAFGEIYEGFHRETKEKVAIKLEIKYQKNLQLMYESHIYRQLGETEGIPKIYWNGKQGNYTVLVMDYLGPSLENILDYCNRQFSLKTTLMLADQMISRVEYMHSKYLLHRDIKPDNFCMGVKDKKTLVYIIDFGLAKYYYYTDEERHISYKTGKSLTGTARYASINTHLGVQQSRRDDIESIGYIMVYFLKGNLPWQGLKASTQLHKYDKVKHKKLETTLGDLCQDLPEEIQTFIKYARDLEFTEAPDYAYLKSLIKIMADREGIEFDGKFDWLENLNGKEFKIPLKPDSFWYSWNKQQEEKEEEEKKRNQQEAKKEEAKKEEDKKEEDKKEEDKNQDEKKEEDKKEEDKNQDEKKEEDKKEEDKKEEDEKKEDEKKEDEK